MPSRRRCDKALWTKIRISRNIRKKCLKWPERLKLQQITVPQTLNRFLTQMQRGTALYKQQASSKESLTEVIEVLESHSKNAEELSTVFHDCNQDKADDLRSRMLL